MFSCEGKIIISVAKGVGLWGRAKSKSLDEPGQEGKEGEKEEMLYNSNIGSDFKNVVFSSHIGKIKS